jgi:hypothetical protein
MATNGYRYVSSFNDVIGIISAETWNPTCEWEYKGDEAAPPAFGFHNVKEKVA